MRPTAWMNCLAVFLLTAAAAASVSTAQARPPRTPAVPPKPDHPSWVVEGDWQSTDGEAVQDALEKAKAKVTDYLHAQTPPMEWSPDPTWIQQKLWRDLKADDPTFKALGWKDAREETINGHRVQVETEPFKGLGDMRRAAVRVEVSQFAQGEIQEQERAYQVKLRQDRAATRQTVLAKALALLVALLAVVACYLRLEDATKGYYTTLLRVVAVAFVALAVAAILALA